MPGYWLNYTNLSIICFESPYFLQEADKSEAKSPGKERYLLQSEISPAENSQGCQRGQKDSFNVDSIYADIDPDFSQLDSPQPQPSSGRSSLYSSLHKKMRLQKMQVTSIVLQINYFLRKFSLDASIRLPTVEEGENSYEKPKKRKRSSLTSSFKKTFRCSCTSTLSFAIN